MADTFARPDAPLCIVTLTYTADLAAVDALMADHVGWLRKGFEAGVLLVAGRQVPRIGGVLLFRGERAAVEEIAATDPFVTGNVATATVTAFNASMAAPAIADLLA